MTVKIRAHFDGKVIVPDDPLDLPVNALLDVQLEMRHEQRPAQNRREQAMRSFLSRPVLGEPIPDEALRRENLYEDR